MVIMEKQSNLKNNTINIGNIFCGNIKFNKELYAIVNV